MRALLTTFLVLFAVYGYGQDDSAGVSIGIKDKSFFAGTLLDSTCNDSSMAIGSVYTVPTTFALIRYMASVAGRYYDKGISDGRYPRKDTLAIVAYNPDYNLLNNKPSIPTALPPNGAASGELTGSYPGPTIGNNTITSGKIVDGTIVDADIATSAGIAYTKLSGTPTIPASQLNSDWNSVSGITQVLNKPTIPTSVLRYNSAGLVATQLKEWDGIITPTSSTAQTVDISSAGFSSIISVSLSVQKDTTNATFVPSIALKSYTNSQVTLSITQGSNNVVAVALIGLSILVGPATIFATNLNTMRVHVYVRGY